MKCDGCIHKEITNEAELYGAPTYYGTGDSIDWCEYNNAPIDHMVAQGFNVENCEDFDFDDKEVINEELDFYDDLN
jgi:hypothetical protein